MFAIEGGAQSNVCICWFWQFVWRCWSVTSAEGNASGTTQNIINGRDFDRVSRAFTIVDEALHESFLHNFKEWCTINDKCVPLSLYHALESLDNIEQNQDVDIEFDLAN